VTCSHDDDVTSRARVNPIVRFERVQKTYDGRTMVVRDLTLKVEPGEFLSVLGPSGSGKTTMLMMLAGFESPTSGEIYLAGRPVTTVPPHQRDIGMVFQHFALFPHLTVRKNVAFPLEVRGRRSEEIETRVARALAMVKLTGLEQRRPAELSGGQQQRVALARAFVFGPSLVLLDEPLGALDRQLRDEMQYELKQIHASLGVTMIYVTHDQSEALTLSGRVAVFRDGQMQQVGTPRDVYERPANAFVARFVGENNSLVGTVVEARDGWRRVQVGGCFIEAVSADAPGPGGTAMLSIRPEHVVLAPLAETTANAQMAQVEDIVYQGGVCRIRLSVPNGFDLVTTVSPRVSDSCTRGAEVAVAWRVEDCRAYAWPGADDALSV